MRKSQVITLVLISASLVACSERKRDREEDPYYGTSSGARTSTHIYYHGGHWWPRPYSTTHTYHVVHTSSPSRSSSSYSSSSSSYGSSSHAVSSSRGGFGSSAHFSSGS